MSKMSLDKLVSVAIGMAAVTLTASVACRTFFTPARVNAKGPSFVSFWREALKAGIPIGGDSTAAVKMIVLSDLECSACRVYHETIQQVMVDHPRDVQVVYVSHPLTMHKFAFRAAQGAECADQVGAFGRWINMIYEKQDSLGLKTWASYAKDAGIADTTALADCTLARKEYPRVVDGMAFAKKVGNPGTPSVILNGWQFGQPPSGEVLNRAVDALLKGKKLEGKSFAVPLGAREAR